MVFLFVIITIILIIIIFSLSKINIEIKNFKFQSISEKHINKDYEIIIKLIIFKIIPIFKINITKTKLEKLKLKEKIKNFDLKVIHDNQQFDKELISTIKELDINIKRINLYIDLGTENASLTAIIIPIISTIIEIIINRKIEKFENQIFVIKPIYINQNLINIYISGIFEIKMSQIINSIYNLNKEKKEIMADRKGYNYSCE